MLFRSSTAIYWNKRDGNLAQVIDKVDKLKPEKIEDIGKKAKARIEGFYSWQFICDKYAEVFLKEIENK